MSAEENTTHHMKTPYPLKHTEPKPCSGDKTVITTWLTATVYLPDLLKTDPARLPLHKHTLRIIAITLWESAHLSDLTLGKKEKKVPTLTAHLLFSADLACIGKMCCICVGTCRLVIRNFQSRRLTHACKSHIYFTVECNVNLIKTQSRVKSREAFWGKKA